MQIPVDIKAVIDEATNIDEARETPISISVYMDESAPGDIQAFVRQAFASASVHARVSISYFPSTPVMAVPENDMAIIVAGLDGNVGAYAEVLRDAGVPVMVVTTMPQLVQDIATTSGHTLLQKDIIAPQFALAEEGIIPFEVFQQAQNEPQFLSSDDTDFLNTSMGEWIIETCSNKRLAFALAFSFVRKPLSLEAVRATAAQNAGVGLVVFIPGADMPIMTLNQAKMLLQIAAAYGEPMGIERVKELAAIVGGAFACRTVARQLIAIVPGLGWAIKAAIGYSGTMAMGHAAVEYFEADGRIEHLGTVVSRARDKAVMAAEKARMQPSAKDAVVSASKYVGKNVQNVADRLVPQAADAVESVAQVVQSVEIPAAKGVLSSAAAKVESAAKRFK